MESLAQPPPRPAGVAGLAVLFEYSGQQRELILGLKRTKGVASIPELADALADALHRTEWRGVPTCVTWVPTTPARRRARGYDQSRLLAKAVARRLRLPCRRLLTRSGHAQQGLDAVARRGAPELSARSVPRGPVLVIDDVLTTGASVSAAAAALRGAGAPEVFAAVLAFAPARGAPIP